MNHLKWTKKSGPTFTSKHRCGACGSTFCYVPISFGSLRICIPCAKDLDEGLTHLARKEAK
jgi:hypothetical protein